MPAGQGREVSIVEVTPHRRSPQVNLKPNVQKILAAIVYIIALAGKENKAVSQYDILKSLFLADKSHMNKYGRPITFDNYMAMRAGPVPSLAYDFLKENRSKLAKYHLSGLPWDREIGANNVFYYSNASIIAFDDALSDSDKIALSQAYNVIVGLTFPQIRRLTHADPAYIDAWEDNESRKAFPMSVGMLFDPPDFQRAETVAFLSKHM